MIPSEVKEYRKEWQKANKQRMRMHKLKWYYKNRVIVNMMFSKAKGTDSDIADQWYQERHPEG